MATGGTLHPRVWEVPGHRDHREDKKAGIEEQYTYSAHKIEVLSGGVLERILGTGEHGVNSLHSQGIASVGPGVRVEAKSTEDGLIEGVSVSGHPWGVGVQWHPEWRFWENGDSGKLFDAFGEAVRTFAEKKRSRKGGV